VQRINRAIYGPLLPARLPLRRRHRGAWRERRRIRSSRWDRGAPSPSIHGTRRWPWWYLVCTVSRRVEWR